MQANVNNLAKQFKAGLQIITLSVSDADFPAGSTARFEPGQWVSFYNHILGINDSYWIHKVVTKILGGAIRNYDLELRNYTLE